MDDITIPDEQDKDDDRLFIRSVREDDDIDFEKHPLDDDDLDLASVGRSLPGGAITPTQMVTIKFANFVQLVANHSYIDIVDKNAEEDVTMSGNLLTELANAHDRSRERKMPLMFIGGLVIGIVLTYIIIK